MDKIKEFFIEESKVNKGIKILIAVTETGEKFVVGGNTNYPPQIYPYEKCWDAIGEAKFKELTATKTQTNG